MDRIEAIASGRVQRVMYRDFVLRSARDLKLVGEVKNLADGTVRVVAEGPRDDLLKLIVRLHTGSAFSHVRGVDVSWRAPLATFSSFDVAY